MSEVQETSDQRKILYNKDDIIQNNQNRTTNDITQKSDERYQSKTNDDNRTISDDKEEYIFKENLESSKQDPQSYYIDNESPLIERREYNDSSFNEFEYHDNLYECLRDNLLTKNPNENYQVMENNSQYFREDITNSPKDQESFMSPQMKEQEQNLEPIIHDLFLNQKTLNTHEDINNKSFDLFVSNHSNKSTHPGRKPLNKNKKHHNKFAPDNTAMTIKRHFSTFIVQFANHLIKTYITKNYLKFRNLEGKIAGNVIKKSNLTFLSSKIKDYISNKISRKNNTIREDFNSVIINHLQENEKLDFMPFFSMTVREVYLKYYLIDFRNDGNNNENDNYCFFAKKSNSFNSLYSKQKDQTYKEHLRNFAEFNFINYFNQE